MESDRDKQRLWATVHRMTRKRMQFYADAEDVSLGTAAARLVRAGLKQHAFIERERVVCSPRVFRDNYGLPAAPPEGEGVRVKIALDDEEISRIRKLADQEFEIEPTILNRLVLWGFDTVSPFHRHWPTWKSYFRAEWGNSASR